MKKSSQKRKPAAERQLKTTPRSPAAAAVPASAARVQWGQEIEHLRQQRFTSVEEVIEALAARVCDKLSMSEREREDQMRFLKDLMLTDPGMRAQLSQLLSIKNS